MLYLLLLVGNSFVNHTSSSVNIVLCVLCSVLNIHTAMATYQIPPPTPMSLTGDVVENWKEFESAWEDYLVATQLDEKLTTNDGRDENVAGSRTVAATLCAVMGPPCKKVLMNLPTTPENQHRPGHMIKALRDYFVPQRNILYERFVFNSTKQKPDEGIDVYSIRLRQLAEPCEFGQLQDDLIRDRIVIGTTDDSGRERLLRERPVPNLARVIENLRAAEMSRSQREVMSGSAKDAVDHLRKTTQGQGQARYQHRQSAPGQGQARYQHRRPAPAQGQRTASNDNPSKPRCNYCDRDKHSREECPAKDSLCRKCQRKGHWATVCRSKSSYEIEQIPITYDSITYDPITYDLGEVKSINSLESNFWSADVSVNRHSTEFKLDSGSKICVVGCSTPWTRGLKLAKTNDQFRGPGGISLDHLIAGVVPHAELRAGNKVHREDIYIMRNQTKNLLSKSAIQALQLLKPASTVYVVESSSDFKAEFPELFKGLGVMQEMYKIPLQEDASPVCLYTPRRVAHPLLPKVKAQLEKMKMSGVISAVTKPTEWCSGMVVVPKPSGEIRVCVDLTPLNKAVKREIHPMATVDDNLAKICGSKIFTKLDAKSGFWQIPLHPESKLLTTFVTPFGRFCFNRLPFGISSAPEVFQRQMSMIVEGIDGVICHMDDLLIHAATQGEHDERVRKVLQRLQNAGVTLNEKCCFSQRSIKFLGHVVSTEGIAADPEKTRAIQEFPRPQNINELQRFLGMTNQLAKFLPGLAKMNEPLRQLLKKEQMWLWDATQQKAFDNVKRTLSSAEVLAHYDPNSKTTVIAADACQDGLGAVLLQTDVNGNRRPIAYASRSLTDTEKRYAVIEKEALASTWACEKFSDYVLGLKFILETDHRPLVPLLSSTELSKMPTRVLRFRLRLMRYAPEMKYVQGTHQQTADALSRAPVDKPTAEDEVFIEETEAFKDSVIRHIPATDHRLEEIRNAQQNDAACTQVRNWVKEGWPPVMPNLPLMRPYWDKAPHFTMNDDILMFDERLVIPQALQLGILEKIHTGHLGITKCKGRAYESVWWPSITSQVEAMCRRCPTCILHQDQATEPLLALSPPEEIWERIGTDLFEFKSKHYLLVVDYGSRWLDFKELGSTTSQAVIRGLCEVFATHGSPKVLISDNGPQYASQQFLAFSKDWGFTHITSSPRYPKANGEAERAVRTAKAILSKNSNPYLGLLAYRSAPIYNGRTPSQLLMSRQLRTSIPTTPAKLTPKIEDSQKIQVGEQDYRSKYAKNHDRHHRVVELPCLNPGDKVFVRDQARYGEVQQQMTNPRSYCVSMENGNTIRRNRSALIHTGNTRETSHPSHPIRSEPLLVMSSPQSNVPEKPATTPTTDPAPKPLHLPKPQSPLPPRRSQRAMKSTQKPDMVYYHK